MRTATVITMAVVATFMAEPRSILACAACFGGDPDAPETRGARVAIIFLLTVTFGVLVGMATFFIYLMRRARHAARIEAGASKIE